jgi:hypothetical protein
VAALMVPLRQTVDIVTSFLPLSLHNSCSAPSDIPQHMKVAELLDDVERARESKISATTRMALAAAATEPIPVRAS